jgi:hypothetical protein
MDNFIQEQIDSYKNKKYNMLKESDKMKNIDSIFVLKIKNNKIIANLDNDMLGRKKNIFLIMSMLIEKYNLEDTILLINLTDGYYWKTDTPVFSFGLPKGKQGLIFPNFDMLYFDLLKKNYNQLKRTFNNYHPDKIKNDMYFKGGPATLKRNLFREKLGEEKLPFNVIATKDYSEPLYKVKDHKYLLDLPGVKPQSLRLKYLFLAQRAVFRVSFYNSKIGETGYWRQFYDYIFDVVFHNHPGQALPGAAENENNSYVHLAYDFDYDNPISDDLYKKIKTDLLKKYIFFEKHPKKYQEMIKHLNKNIKKLTIDSMLKYLYRLITKYRQNICLEKISN